MQPRSERQKILWAVFLSLLLHLVVGVSIASFGDKLQPSLPEDEKPVELTIVNLAPMPTPRRCFRLGAAVKSAVESLQASSRVLIVANGGLSHNLSGPAFGLSQRGRLC